MGGSEEMEEEEEEEEVVVVVTVAKEVVWCWIYTSTKRFHSGQQADVI